mmetsp:Transcript_28059/g.70451  ORF Transcript_28059/g.70451 Transcript_28059/m.70451 type:complete len:128 (-) Transcript_28059:172-555(-)
MGSKELADRFEQLVVTYCDILKTTAKQPNFHEEIGKTAKTFAEHETSVMNTWDNVRQMQLNVQDMTTSTSQISATLKKLDLLHADAMALRSMAQGRVPSPPRSADQSVASSPSLASPPASLPPASPS